MADAAWRCASLSIIKQRRKAASLRLYRSVIQLDMQNHEPPFRAILGNLQILLFVASRLHETLRTREAERAPGIGLQPQREQSAGHATEKPDRFMRQACIELLRDVGKNSRENLIGDEGDGDNLAHPSEHHGGS
ncbi:hypothetical protein [Paraburkholderia sp. RL17-337-BIB-A]|uniref:hypothetical protein n=1 Tax=Paraburkholderia sp. RL17-337-BIB-A TaxID=3031636 RepID=UPI0038B883CA